MKQQVRGRFAPSPTGDLHAGNVFAFLAAWLSCRAKGGRMVLRMEDLGHVVPGAADRICRDLERLGLDWDEGYGAGGPHAPYLQSERLECYKEAIEQLHLKGAVYPCSCPRHSEHGGLYAPHSGEYVRYDGFCRGRFASYAEARSIVGTASGRFPAWRFKVPDEEIVFEDMFQGEQRWNVWKQHGDFVLARHPDGVGYQLAVVVDDIAMGITEVIRGYDLLDCTPWQILLYRELAPDHPLPEFGHVPLITDAAGNRLAKRNGAATIAAQLDSGTPPQKIIGDLAAQARWVPAGTQLTPAELLKYYKPETLKK
ncbi:MAG: tRNA glutamyl-Q(34) synthetase GluQRS [Lentisphaeria bacterium]|nr:tRNA glutamyl-Q(34) synthetase GluQRS [Lentisphaeria bacterium]